MSKRAYILFREIKIQKRKKKKKASISADSFGYIAIAKIVLRHVSYFVSYFCMKESTFLVWIAYEQGWSIDRANIIH